MTSEPRRRRSQHLSFGNSNWSYAPQTDRVRLLDGQHADPSAIRFDIRKQTSLFHYVARVASISIVNQTLTISSKKHKDFPLTLFLIADVHRLTPKGTHSVLLKVTRPHSIWVRNLTFTSQQDRDEFMKLVKGVQLCGNLVMTLHTLLEENRPDLREIDLLSALDKLTGPDVKVPNPAPLLPVSATDAIDAVCFFRWFLQVLGDQGSAQELADQLQSILCSTSTTNNNTETIPAMSSPTRSISHKRSMTSAAVSGPLFVEPVLLEGETIELIEDMVSVKVPIAEGREVRHIVGGLVLTNYRIMFSIYKSLVTTTAATKDVQRLRGDGIIGLVTTTNNLEQIQTTGFHTIRICLPSQTIGRKPDVVPASFRVPVASIMRIKPLKDSTVSFTTVFGKTYVLQFDRADGEMFLQDFVSRLAALIAPSATPFYNLAAARTGRVKTVPVFDAFTEFKRQGVLGNAMRFALFPNNGGASASSFSSSPHQNKPNSYVIDTYPAQFIVPLSCMAGDKIRTIAKFRSRRRIPAVTWGHPTNGAVLARSAQPQIGIQGHRCVEDEEIVRALEPLSERPNSTSPRMFIVDARGLPAVVGNQVARGKGAETPQNYPDTILIFMGVANIHTMRTSHERLAQVCNGVNGDKWLSKLESTGWLLHIRNVLWSSCRVAELLEIEAASVLVHCSDGWDRTSQMACLAQIMLDPFFRTMRGLAVLVEKDWIGFGFKFADRCLGINGEEERSPIYIQFVDCLYQFVRQYPAYFEYNELALLALCDAVYDKRFVTFCFNTERERAMEIERTGAGSFWDWFLDEVRGFTNVGFIPYENGPLFPVTDAKKIVVWEALHFRGDPSCDPFDLRCGGGHTSGGRGGDDNGGDDVL